MKISIVIPNYNGRQLLAKHLPEVVAESQGAEIIVSDDASTDDSVSFLHQNFPLIKLVVKPKNRGFSAAINAGVKAASGDIIVLLNTDIEPEKDFLTTLLENFADPNVFATSIMDKSVEPDGSVVLRGRGLGFWQKGLFFHRRGEVSEKRNFWANGGSAAFRRDVWNQLNGLDEIYNPFYVEDIDLSYRAQKAGYKILFEPKSVVWHYHETGAIKTHYSASFREEIAFRNQLIFVWKNITDSKMLLEHLFFLPYHLFRPIFSGNFTLLKGFLRTFTKIPAILYSRLHLPSAKIPDRAIFAQFKNFQ